jgi:hypothetical protein
MTVLPRHAGECRLPRLPLDKKKECRFLKKAAPKTFVSFYAGCFHVPREQKFFGAFFQKRTAFF